MLIQEEEEGKRPFGGGPKKASGEGGTKDRSALRRFSPLVVKRGYKAQRDGLGESCTRCARPLSLTYSFRFSSCFCSSPPSPPPRFSEEWLDCFRCANLTMQRGLTFLPLQVRRDLEGGKGTRARLTLSHARAISSAIEQIHRALERVSTRRN